MSETTYVGTELELFAGATVWKSYLASRIVPHLGDEVLEVGAGLGGTTRRLCVGPHARWVCLEPDPALADQITRAVRDGELPDSCRVELGTTRDMDGAAPFDAILYIDVLEHIEDDRGEVERAYRLLKPGGRIIALSPAHPWLYTPFDRAIGHYRRYTRKSFAAIAPHGAETVRLDYLDSVGLLASLGNKLILHSDMPKPGQIAFWDRVLVRLSKVVDPLVFHAMGKSVLAIWRRPANGEDRRP
jgi:ubiquinone/menaquinone biosynthesis C-methylase UbiE